MLKAARAAEWILSLVTTRERAAATVGDCLEDTRGAFAFWWFVLRTMGSLCAREAWESRWRILRLSLYGVVIEMLITPVFVITPMMLLISVSYALGGKNDALGLSGWLALIMGTAIVPLIVGRMVAKRSGGRELASALALAILRGITGLIITMALALFRHQTPQFFFPVSYDAIFIVAGALSWRARHPRAA